MPTVFSISPTTAEVNSTQGTVTVTLSSFSGGWSASTADDWLTITPTEGYVGDNTSVVSYNENTGSSSRVGIVTFTSELGMTATLTITQSAASVPSGGNIFVGDQGISIMLGNDEIPAIYCGDELLYPISLGTLTGITIENLTWVTDVPYSGGTATKDNCSYKVLAHYDSGKSKTVTSKATVTGSLVVPATTAETREMVGVLQLTATYEGFTAIGSVDAYQKKYSKIPDDGIYIYTTDDDYYLASEWNNQGTVVGVAVISRANNVAFVIPNGVNKTGQISPSIDWGTIGYGDTNGAKTDFNGYANTQQIISVIGDSADYAPGYCTRYVFPNGKTGYLGACGEYQLIATNKVAVKACFDAFGGTMNQNLHTTSTQSTSTNNAWISGAYGTNSSTISQQAKTITLFQITPLLHIELE